MTKEELDEIRERCKKATPGPWTDDGYRVYKERSSGSFVRSSEREERPVYTECLLDLTGGRKDQGHFRGLRMQWLINGPSKIGW